MASADGLYERMWISNEHLVSVTRMRIRHSWQRRRLLAHKRSHASATGLSRLQNFRSDVKRETARSTPPIRDREKHDRRGTPRCIRE